MIICLFTAVYHLTKLRFSKDLYEEEKSKDYNSWRTTLYGLGSEPQDMTNSKYVVVQGAKNSAGYKPPL